MENKLLLRLIIAAFILASCNQKENKQVTANEFPIVYQGHLYIPGNVNNIKGNYVFDTGASNLYLDDTHYADHDFEYKNTSTGLLPGVGNKPQMVTIIKDTVQFNFGNYKYKTTTVPVIQLKPILGDIADGIIGLEYFHESVLEINYVKEYMKLYPNIDSLDVSEWYKIKLTKKNNRLYVPLKVSINDSINIAGNFLLDFGSGGSVSLTSLVSKEFNLAKNIDDKIPYFTQYGGIGGESSSYDFITNTVTLGDFAFSDVIMDFSTDKGGALASKKYLGIIGNKIFERFDILIDFKKNTLYLKPNKNFNTTFTPSRLGFSYVDRSQTLGHWVVSGLYSSLHADQAGLKIDDEILSINDVDVREIHYEDQKSYFDDKDEIKLNIKRNDELIEIIVKLQPVLSTANKKLN